MELRQTGTEHCRPICVTVLSFSTDRGTAARAASGILAAHANTDRLMPFWVAAGLQLGCSLPQHGIEGRVPAITNHLSTHSPTTVWIYHATNSVGCVEDSKNMASGHVSRDNRKSSVQASKEQPIRAPGTAGPTARTALKQRQQKV